MSSLDSSDEEDLQSRFGPLLSITAASVVALAGDVRHRISGRRRSLGDELVSRLSGSYNLVYIVRFDDDVKYVVRVPAVGWGCRHTETAQRSLESQALTMRFLKRKTMVPLPDVYAFDTKSDNLIRAPYMVMSFIPGATVGSRWFDKTGPTPLEERRQRTLDSLAKAMCQFQGLQFDKIGSLKFQDSTAMDQPDIGPCYQWDEGPGGDQDYGEKLMVKEFGPFITAQDYLQHCLDHDGRLGAKHPLPIGARKLVAIMIPYLPSAKKARETFVLAPPDFDSQNVMIDERGNITGIIDWDHVHTEPRFLGYSRFPSWITRDWDPLMYMYPHSPRENSPDELKRYRSRYNSQVKKHLNGQGDSLLTIKSHIFEAVAISAFDSRCRLEIVLKMVDQVIPPKSDYDAFGLILSVGDQTVAPRQMREVTDGLAALLSDGRC
ncbi:MAG: hypothetical protein M1837_002263 [Sclerophora amabilis]|nr:MAG: hypothetical protein M1837_002263 [Sclerophora amabilis]